VRYQKNEPTSYNNRAAIRSGEGGHGIITIGRASVVVMFMIGRYSVSQSSPGPSEGCVSL
jgi:hypothetical protein